ncbi:ABC transporter permease [Paenibacillus sp. GSMTC-2017]|uniref:nickel ABC transporter permease n=1 Tax=Paenibacillus sp. GSMTC-2017 TaxID=2794350 RepID=UPI0018D65E2B|nr:nickel ABC transporter permease [Paenibacillus sp. GSMTC-2017]MBH5316995.1 ABC transporter permease [Paenibacillus sp. GSMTC-2017]
MLLFIGRRSVAIIIVLFLLSGMTFVLMKYAPGDPVLTILNIDEVAVTQADEEAMREKLGFNKPIYDQYFSWLKGLFKLDLGYSYSNDRMVMELLMERLPLTLQLLAGGVLIMIVIAAPLGVLASRYPNRWPDRFSQLFALLGASIPNFLLGLLLVYFLAYKFNLFPTMGTGSLKHFILPSLTLGFSMSAIYSRLLRSGLIDSMSQQYVRAARARGLSETRILMTHALRPALLPLITVLGMSMGSLVAGTVVVEIMFALPGLGSLAIDAILQRDYPVIQGYVLLIGLFIVVIQFIVDFVYGIIDPRIRYGKGEPL